MDEWLSAWMHARIGVGWMDEWMALRTLGRNDY